MPVTNQPGSIVRLSVGDAWAEVALYGSTVLSWHPASAPSSHSALFLSQATKPGKPYRGGVPLVFPLFGEVADHADVPDTIKKCPRHGFCRDRNWKQTGQDDKEDEHAQVTMSLSSDDDASLLDKFPFAFTLQHTVTLTRDSLKLALHLVHHPSSQHTPMPFHALFHNYLHLPSSTALVTGLKGIGYRDKVAGGSLVANNEVAEQGWDQVIDRVYRGSAPTLTIAANDGSGTVITIERTPTIPDTTIWNPGKEAADGMADMQADGWKQFVCAEPGQVDSFTRLDRGKEWTGSQTLRFSQDTTSQSYLQGAAAAASTVVAGSLAALGLGGSAAGRKPSKEAGSGTNAGEKADDGGTGSSKLAAEMDGDKTPLSKAVHTAVKGHYDDQDGPHADKSSSDKDAAAARLIQRNYRKYVGKREEAGMMLSPDARWGDAMGRVRLNEAQKASKCGDKNDVGSRWKRGGLLVGQLAGSPSTQPQGGGKDMGAVEGGPSLRPNEALMQTMNDKEQKSPEEGEPEKTESKGMIGDVPGANEEGKVDNIRSIAKRDQRGLRLIERWTKGAPAQELSKIMEAQYWLEMVDKSHRYGSNLKHYHEAWVNDTETNDNFFKWLEEGQGKDLDLPDCPRERLEKEKITYLSAEQRANYVVDIADGKLVWRRNGKPVDTSRGRHRDLGHGGGIVELGPEEQEELQRKREERAARRGKPVRRDSGSSSSSSSSSSSDEDEDEDNKEDKKEAAHHYGADQSSSKKHLSILSTAGSWDALLRKTVGQNCWIYVYNTRHELFVGLKTTGKFQHSSFLYGGRVLSAGLLKVKNGVLTSLNPLSGHYRAGTAHFRFFVAALQDSGANLERVTLSKSLLILRGLEVYGKMNKKLKGGSKKKESQTEKSGEEKDKDDEPTPSEEKQKGLRHKLGLKTHGSEGQAAAQAAA